MYRRAVLTVVVIAAMVSPALAQSRGQISANIGWVLSDGVSGDAIRAGDGNTYDTLDPKDAASFHFTVGFFTSPNTEVGFLYGRQFSELQVKGTATTAIDTMGVDNYHGYFAYNFGDPDARVRPYALIGLGATHYSGVNFTTSAGAARDIPGVTRFSTTWGAGVNAYAGGNVGFRAGVRWTPTYIKSDAAGWWCDPWWGCYVVGDAQYSNQFELSGGVTFKF